MRRGVSGSGFIVLILVGAIVVYIALRALESVQPTARELRDEPTFAGEQVLQDSGGVDRGAPAPPIRPSVHDAQEKTATHNDRVKNALADTQ